MPSTVAAGLAAGSAATGPHAAGDAVAAAAAAVGRPSLVLLFADRMLDADAAAAQATAAAGGAPVVGLTSWGGLVARGPVEDGCVAAALGPEMGIGIGVTPITAGLRDAAGAATAEALSGLGARRRHPAVLLLIPSDAGDQADAVAGAYDVAGPRVPLAGGGAMGAPGAQLAGGRAHRGAVVAVALDSPGGAAVGIADGCTRVGLPALVTRADGRTVEQLDGRPAEAVYLEGIGHERPADDTAFEKLAASHPLLQAELRGDVRLRHVLGRTPAGGLRCTAAMPPNAAVAFTRQTAQAVVASAAAAAGYALERLEVPARAALVFDCAARRRAAGDLLDAEVASLARALGPDVAVAGGYTAGEIGRGRGTKGDRNHACVVLALG